VKVYTKKLSLYFEDKSRMGEKSRHIYQILRGQGGRERKEENGRKKLTCNAVHECTSVEEWEKG
jgi:hypothetical protein